MQSLRVTTWNVLHRVHAVNWKEAPLKAFPSETSRIAGITARVKGWLDEGVAVVGLQEVSGDQLASLRGAIGSGAQIFEHTYPRVPRIRGPEAPELEDATEHLVAIVDVASPSIRRARTFDTDPGKGFLAIDIGHGITVIVTHVSAHERGEAQLNELAAFARALGERTVVLGDFNASIELLRTAFDKDAISDVVGQIPTRIPTGGHTGRTIDHVIVAGGAVSAATVLDGQLLSDHNPVAATVTFA